MTDSIAAFKQYLLFIAIFYLTGKIKRESPLHPIRHAHLEEFLNRINEYKGDSVDELTTKLKAIPNQDDGGTNEFVRAVNKAINNRNKDEILQAASLFDIKVINVRNLLTRAREVLPEPLPSKLHSMFQFS